MGLEPTSGGTTILCLNHLATLAIALTTITPFSKNDLPFQRKFFQNSAKLGAMRNSAVKNRSEKYQV